MNRTQQYFNSLARQLSAEAQRAGTSSHKPDIGSNREVIVERFLRNHLPKRLTPSIGGNVVGFEGMESNQIDIVISNEIAVRFDEDARTFTTAEGAAAAITVKSILDKNALEDCLLNLASVPQAHPSVLTFDALNPGSFYYFVERHPTFYAFAFQGIQPHTCLDHVIGFYRRYPQIPKNRYPRGIIVNCEYLIEHRLTDARTTTGAVARAGTFHLAEFDEGYQGYPLVQMLTNISYYASWLPYMA